MRYEQAAVGTTASKRAQLPAEERSCARGARRVPAPRSAKWPPAHSAAGPPGTARLGASGRPTGCCRQLPRGPACCRENTFSCSCKAVPVLIELSSLQITTGTRYRAPASFASLMKRLQQQLSTRKKKKKKRIQQPDHAWYTSDPQLDQGAVPHVLTCGAGSSDRWQSAPRTCTAPRRAYTDRQQRSPEGEGGN